MLNGNSSKGTNSFVCSNGVEATKCYNSIVGMERNNLDFYIDKYIFDINKVIRFEARDNYVHTDF